MSDLILTLKNVHTDIAQYHILHGVDLDVPRGAVTMMLGRNGVGKTTTLRTIMGLWAARDGAISFDGQDITGLPTPARARLGLGFVPEDMGIFTDLTVEENMMLAAASGPLDAARKERIFTAFPPLRTFWDSEAGNLSGGQKQMLSIARAMAETRKLYLIDEPTKGLAPAIVSTMAAALRELKDEGATILMVEQNFAVAKALGDYAAVMDDGRIVWTGTMAELAGSAELQEKFMGLSMEAGA
ncbi:ABC transporter ATP-binding protein [Primorskyibacter aestuariivivens]|uniref:ABC transporter ATP-binding protein n=1 Tax=Primorskyibacter aestuariivivens TaxID=1888912 RepID=UPI002300F8C6|nr:ABC transporter ATP-binding protein [Primorskyibacter aestuariivivens]MDA7427301.1 ABC transporter ATP-binding protein [Primorskyibacter aestuariivivens]